MSNTTYSGYVGTNEKPDGEAPTERTTSKPKQARKSKRVELTSAKMKGNVISATMLFAGMDGVTHEWGLTLDGKSSSIKFQDGEKWHTKRKGNKEAILIELPKYLPDGYTVDMLMAEIKAKAGE